MGMQVVRRGGLLVQMGPGPTLTTNARETLLPLVATLLLEAGRRPPEAQETEGGDEQDRT